MSTVSLLEIGEQHYIKAIITIYIYIMYIVLHSLTSTKITIILTVRN